MLAILLPFSALLVLVQWQREIQIGAACLVIDLGGNGLLNEMISAAVDFLVQRASFGSDPGICVAWETAAGLSSLVDFGLACTRRKMSQKDAMQAAGSALFLNQLRHLSSPDLYSCVPTEHL